MIATSTTSIHLDEFYRTLAKLEHILGGTRILSECNGKMEWPERGVYFFFEPGECRSADPSRLRVVRVGTHMVQRSKGSFWGRLRMHRGTEKGFGNHRQSVFRKHVGNAIMRRSKGEISVPTWANRRGKLQEDRQKEAFLEGQVSAYIGKMPFLWVSVPDAVGPHSDRSIIEKNAVGLLSGSCNPVDPPSRTWLGSFNYRHEIRNSGLWNVQYVNRKYEAGFLDVLAKHVEALT